VLLLFGGAGLRHGEDVGSERDKGGCGKHGQQWWSVGDEHGGGDGRPKEVVGGWRRKQGQRDDMIVARYEALMVQQCHEGVHVWALEDCEGLVEDMEVKEILGWWLAVTLVGRIVWNEVGEGGAT